MWSMLERRTRAIWRAAIILALAGASAIALREVVLSSTFQLFGDYVARVDTPERVVALTFDDGPSPYWTPKFLSALAARQVRATFFMMGRNVERYPSVAREVLTRGHEIGNHSYSHEPWFHLYSDERIEEELDRTENAIEAATGRRPTAFRGPGYSLSKPLLHQLATRGFYNEKLDQILVEVLLGVR